MATPLTPEQRARRTRTNGVIFIVFGALFLLLGLLALLWPFAAIGVLLALAGVYGVRRGGKLRAALTAQQ